VYDRPVIRSFGDDATSHVFHAEDTKAARRLPKAIWPVIRRKLEYLHAARSVQELRLPPANCLEALAGKQRGRHSIRVNDQFRVTFRFESGDAWEVRCEDYH
jgi:proteic killer suppression protein